MKVTMKTKMFQDQKTITQAKMKVTAKFLTLFLVKILVTNGDGLDEQTSCANTTTQNVFGTKKVH